MEKFTSNNHYNPCFWVALWNREYFAEFQATESSTRHARDQLVWVWNLRSDRIYQTTVESVHYHKGFGVAPITPESMLDWCRRWHPDKFHDLAEYVREHPDTLYIDFEKTLHGLEQTEAYSSIMEAARTEHLHSRAHQGFLGCGLMMHAMRSYEFSTAMLEAPTGFQGSKWEYLWLLKTGWANQTVLARACLPLAMGKWTFWRTAEPTFALGDSPVMILSDGLIAVLSPRLLLEIDLTAPPADTLGSLRDDLPEPELETARELICENTSKELVAWDRETLESWRRSSPGKRRLETLSSKEGRNAAITEAAERVRWGIMGFGRIPPDFETWAPSVREKALQSDEGRAFLAELRRSSNRRGNPELSP